MCCMSTKVEEVIVLEVYVINTSNTMCPSLSIQAVEGVAFSSIEHEGGKLFA